MTEVSYNYDQTTTNSEGTPFAGTSNATDSYKKTSLGELKQFSAMERFIGHPNTAATRLLIEESLKQEIRQIFVENPEKTWACVDPLPRHYAVQEGFISANALTTASIDEYRGTLWENGLREQRVFFSSSLDNFSTGAMSYVKVPDTTNTTAAWTDSFLNIRETAATSYLGVTLPDMSRNMITWQTDTSLTIDIPLWVESEVSKKNRITSLLKDSIKANILIKSSVRGNILGTPLSPQELKARQSLRDLISEKEWRRYITNGFLMVRGSSGKFYQIFKNQSFTKVYEHGKLISEICIHTDKSCPPTDHILNLKLLIELDEQAVWSGGNVHKRNGTNPRYKEVLQKHFPKKSQNIVQLCNSLKKTYGVKEGTKLALLA